MEKITVKSEYFSPIDTLLSGQCFRFKEYKKGYLVISSDKICYVYNDEDNVIIETEFLDYFEKYFDINFDYQSVYNFSKNFGNETLKLATEYSKGVRILKQNPFETIFTFIVSQNNNVKRIANTIQKLCEKVGEKLNSPFGEYYAFPTLKGLSLLTEEDYKSLGLGYRARYFLELTNSLSSGLRLDDFETLTDLELYNALTSINGIGDKVASCIMLFGYYRTNYFPVDTWVEKIYREDFNGTLKDRKKMSLYFTSQFGSYSGYIQQYLFYYKRFIK